MSSRLVGLIVVLIVASNIFTGCVEEFTDEEKKEPFVPADDSMATDQGVMSVVNGSNQFAFELYSLLKDDDKFGGNVFISPYSISVALGLLYEGTRGQTAEEILSVFHFPEDNITRLSSFARLYNLLNGGGPEYTLSTANSMWYQDGLHIEEEYRNRTERYYMADVHHVNFAGAPELARVEINDWIEDETNDKIKDMIERGMINGATEVVGVNAIYFNGDWVYEFDPDDTEDREFKVSSGKNVTVPMMYQKGTFNYTWTPDMKVLELPYKGDDLSMLVLLPHDDMDDLEEMVNETVISELREDLHETDLEIHLPRFEFETKYPLNDNLSALGMPTVFSSFADLSGIFGTGGRWIDWVIHQTYVKVNEEGTEAAAATAWATTRGPGPPEFRADHPFMFLIQHKDTGAILFMGKVVDPSFEIEE